MLSIMTSLFSSRRLLYAKHLGTQLADVLAMSRHSHHYHVSNALATKSYDIRRNGSGTVFHKYMGRLGNQLFQYAAITEIARQNNMDACIRDSGEVPLSAFFEGIGEEESCESTQPLNYRIEDRYGGWQTFELPKEDIVLEGSFQSYKYIDPKLRTRLLMKPLIAHQAKGFTEVLSEHVLVGMHIRRYEEFHLRIPSEQYFKNAMKYFTTKFADVGFVVVSDDVEWCKKQDFLQRENIHIVPVNPPVIDLAILIECDHIILSVGTFGWWGSYLGADSRAGGEIVYYDSEFVRESPVNIGQIHTPDYYPPHWVALGDAFQA
jgi:galactoside 2-L-fucosyltransferase 1/2